MILDDQDEFLALAGRTGSPLDSLKHDRCTESLQHINIHELLGVLKKELANIGKLLKNEGDVACVIHEEGDDDSMICITAEEFVVETTADARFLANVIHPAVLPDGVKVFKNYDSGYFVGFDNSKIINYDSCRIAF